MMQLRDSEGTLRMTDMAQTDRLLWGAENAEQRLALLDTLQESDRLQWLLDQEDEMLASWSDEDEN